MRSRRGGDFQAPIIRPQWADARTIQFVGTEGEGTKQLYHVDIITGERQQLSQMTVPGEYVTTAVDIVKRPGERASLAYKTQVHVLKEGPLDVPLNQYPSAAVHTARVDEDPLFAVFHPFKSWVPTSRVYTRYQGEAPRVLTEGYVLGPWLSPDGRYAVVGMPIEAIPEAWHAYEMPETLKNTDLRLGLAHRLTYQFHLLDMRTGDTKPMLDAPVGPPGHPAAFFIAAAFWSADGSRVLLVNTRQPLSDERAELARQSYIIDYRVADGRWEEVTSIRSGPEHWLSGAQWDEPHERVLLQWAMNYTRGGGLSKGLDEGTLLTRRGGRWEVSTVPASQGVAVDAARWPDDLKVYVQEEDMNTPQVMVAARGGRTVALSPPDPALSGVHRQHWERMDIEYGDRTIRGYLLRPVGVSGPAPLVIQFPHISHDEQFSPDGRHPTHVYAGQSLAARGFAVLMMDSPMMRRAKNIWDSRSDESILSTPREGPEQVRAIDAAIGQLSSAGVVDAARVGLIGFSRAGYHVYYVVTHPGKYRIGAAVVFDSYTGGYGDYVNAMAIGSNLRTFPEQYAFVNERGEAPIFWENKQGWLDAPAFNLEKVRTPTLFSVTGLHSAYVMLETVGGWRHMQLPFEYRMYPQGSHVLNRPKEREDALRGTAEWMEFWLQDRAPPDAGRAAAWEALKDNWQARLKVIDAGR